MCRWGFLSLPKCLQKHGPWRPSQSGKDQFVWYLQCPDTYSNLAVSLCFVPGSSLRFHQFCGYSCRPNTTPLVQGPMGCSWVCTGSFRSRGRFLLHKGMLFLTRRQESSIHTSWLHGLSSLAEFSPPTVLKSKSIIWWETCVVVLKSRAIKKALLHRA